MKRVNWLLLLSFVAFGIFVAAILSYFRMNQSISTQILENSEDLNISKSEDSIALDARQTGTQRLPTTDNQEWEKFVQELEQWFEELDKKEELDQSRTADLPAQDDIELIDRGEPAREAIPKADSTESLERERRITEIKQRLASIYQQIKELEEEEAALPPRYPPGQEPTTQTPEEMQRDAEIAARRRELRLRSVELGREQFMLSRQLKELQKEQ